MLIGRICVTTEIPGFHRLFCVTIEMSDFFEYPMQQWKCQKVFIGPFFVTTEISEDFYCTVL